jgi:hypothetical protein
MSSRESDRIIPRGQSSAHCHKMVAEVAKAAAAEHYELLMSASNAVYKAWLAAHPGMRAKALQDAFVARFWGDCIPVARATMAAMLRGPLDERAKAGILEALVLDASLIKGRVNPMQVVGQLDNKGQ